MIVKDIVDILQGEIICEGDLNQEIKTACGSDMMSDVLAFVKDQSVLLWDLSTPGCTHSRNDGHGVHCFCQRQKAG